MPDIDDLEMLADDHDDEIDKDLEKAGDAAERGSVTATRSTKLSSSRKAPPATILVDADR